MRVLCYTLRPLTAFGTPLAGDTLFGQLCWTLRHQLGHARLQALLEGYTAGRPFAVVSDAMPSGHVPLPVLPSSAWDCSDNTDRKALKKRRWLAVSDLARPLAQWQSVARTDAELAPVTERAQPHNTINRQSGTTGSGPFAPYSMTQRWYTQDTRLDLHVALDDSRLSEDELGAALAYIGATGFGRDASIGLGKFELVDAARLVQWPRPAGANCYLTLGPSAPQGQDFCPVRSSWQVLTRFGRHGDAAVQGGSPFKKPLLLAQAGAVFRPETLAPALAIIGQGLGGELLPISAAMPQTVHQGYAPVIPIQCPEVAA
ncbi:type III-A CRISPR-associated RAMP protein Csm4 [Malikia spinosa]|uniref:type III-A CRISPR-associated RAMP protein Csm4 n=1 Tax=Malikia spinosa TaxID=86180 RepID=UPI003FA33C8C